MKLRKLSIFIIVISIGIFFFYPIETDSVPEWRLQVVDSENNAMPDVKIRQTWNIFGEHNEEDLNTDNEGFITFPKRVIREPRILILLQETISKINFYVMAHGASECPCSSVFPVSGARTNYLKYYEGKELEHKMIMLNYPIKDLK